MEILLFFLAMAVFLAVIFVREAVDARKKEKKFIKSLYDNYGGIPDKEYSLERYARMGSYYEKHIQEGQIDDITWNDLDMDEIFKRMNYTFSASGEEYLYYKLRNTNQNPEELEHFEDVVNFFENNPDERVKIQYLMRKLGHTGKFSLYDYIDNLDFLGERSNRRHVLLNLLFLPMIALIPFNAGLGIVGIAGLMIYNILSYFKEKSEIDPYIISFAYILRLINICDELLKINIPVCRKEWEYIKEHQCNLRGMRRGAFLVMGAERSKTTGNPLDIILDYLRMVFHLDLIQFNKMLNHLRLHTEDVDGLITCVGYVETAIATGAFRKSLPVYCVPELSEQEEEHTLQKTSEGTVLRALDGTDGMVLTEAYHPLIADAVRNSISTRKGVLLTGSNASGKSTFLKTVAINAILAQTIHTCTADSYKAPFFRIYSSMALRDDISGGESYYIVEIKALKRILDAASRSRTPVLCFVDEVLRGTNTVERIAASTQILKSLTGMNILCFAATHDIELTELLKNDYNNYHFEEEVLDGDVVFNYKLLKGEATTRNAIKLLEVLGYQSEIIERASAQAEAFIRTGTWT